MLHSQMNYRKSYNKIYHVTSNLLPHYLAKIECSIAGLSFTLVRIVYTTDTNVMLR